MTLTLHRLRAGVLVAARYRATGDAGAEALLRRLVGMVIGARRLQYVMRAAARSVAVTP